MPFMSNFVALRAYESGLYLEGETNQELVAAAARMFVGIRPAASDSPEMQVYEADVTSDWSVRCPLEPPIIAAGVAILKDGGPPFVWAEEMTVKLPPDEPLTTDVDIPGINE